MKGANPRRAKTVCAKFRSGVCFGVGFALERACGPECVRCSGKPFHRSCRLFDFKPHYDVKLEWKDQTPEFKVSDGLTWLYAYAHAKSSRTRTRTTASVQTSFTCPYL